MLALSIQRSIDNCCFPFRPAPNNREIFVVQTMLLHEQSEPPPGHGRFRDEDQSAGFAVETIGDCDLAAVCDLEREQFAQFFPKCGALVGFGWMRQEKRRLVDHDVIVGLVEDSKIANDMLEHTNFDPETSLTIKPLERRCRIAEKARRSSTSAVTTAR